MFLANSQRYNRIWTRGGGGGDGGAGEIWMDETQQFIYIFLSSYMVYSKLYRAWHICVNTHLINIEQNERNKNSGYLSVLITSTPRRFSESIECVFLFQLTGDY